MNNLIDSVRVNTPLIRSRAAGLALPDEALTRLLGVSLADLERDLDQRFVSLTMLVRLSRLLDCTIDELITVNRAHSETPPAPAGGDDAVILALSASYYGITVDRILTVLRWSTLRLDAALTSLAQQLESTPLRLIVTDNHVAIGLRVNSLAADTRERLDAEYRYRQPLRAHEATTLITLITNKILEPFPGNYDSQELLREFEATELITQGLAVPTAPGPEQASRVEPHPDIMFALRLVEHPAQDETD
jgi:hypothetical protein